MTSRTAMNALAEATAGLVTDYDVVSVLTTLVRSCAAAIGAEAVGIMVKGAVISQKGDLELLAASSHDAGELELFQAQVHEGPCFDAIAVDDDTTAAGAAELAQRWPRMGVALTAAGYRALHATPLRWRGSPFGSINVFLREERQPSHEERALVRAFADIATLAIVHAGNGPAIEEIARGVQEALDGRIVIEQAKGVLCHQEQVDPAAAFSLLIERAQQGGEPLADVARGVLRAAERGDRWNEGVAVSD